MLFGAAPREAGASRLVRTPSFDIVIQRSVKIVDRGQPLQMDITVAPRANVDDVNLTVVAFERSPFGGPRRLVQLRTRADDLHHYTAVASFPARGVWILRFTVGLQNGQVESAEFPLPVTDPNGLAPPLAWLIGTSPLVALFGFALGEAARAHRLAGRRERFDVALVS
jgi:hypothetical protein